MSLATGERWRPPPQPPPHAGHYSDSDTNSDSESDPVHSHADLSSSIFKAYLDCQSLSSSSTTTTTVDLAKIKSFLASSSSGALSCLICLERIKNSDPTWSCTSLCFAVFHLFCIQAWARQSLDAVALRAIARLPITAEKAEESAAWNCPKCRSSYSKLQIPKRYVCFCGKLENPPGDDPWILPHSCNEVCGRSLSNDCGHFCLLLCHPGPCPSCPKLVKSSCFCGSTEDIRRCGSKRFSCAKICNRVLDCESHRCKEICHNDECPPCRVRRVISCRCGKVKEERDCCDRVFRCENPCENVLSCRKHSCERGCHQGECGECPYQGRRTCPCGKRVHEGLPCDVQVPLCGASCEKTLLCGLHRCPERCHRGSCAETCRITIFKYCRCGGLKKQVPCYQDLTCERKCQKIRDCARHPCKRRCCDGECPPCSEICGRRLRCKNHKCSSPCHQGQCAPCPIMVTISCHCGETRFEVPCGTEKIQKPPRCRKLCLIPRLCRHSSTCKPHRCHYGACPLCRLACEEEYPCGHKCNLRCHGPIPPPNPDFTLKPKKKKFNYPSEVTPGSPCPPCPELVWRSCLGQHHGAERMMVCSDRVQFSCENLCGNLLPCSNHYCTKYCHALNNQLPSSTLDKISESCEKCHLPCQKERRPACQHPCPRRCHPEECPPCKVLIKRSCHCGAMVHAFECIYYNTLSKEEQITVRSCRGPCHKKLPNCTHLCPETCHQGQCPSPEKCCKKVTVRCKCQTLKKEWLCRDVQAAYHDMDQDPKEVSKNQFGQGLLQCNFDCKSKVPVVDSVLLQRKSKDVEEKKPETEKNTQKRRKKRDRVKEGKQISRVQKLVDAIKWLLLLVALVAGLIAVTYFGYKGILWLSDWMNEIEEHRKSKRYPRI